MRVQISRCVVELIQQAADEAAPDEACGLLFGDSIVTHASITANVAADPSRHFEIDPAALIAALRAERTQGERVAGFWHSHPAGDATPSATDAAMAAADGKLWLIVAGGAVAGWRALKDGDCHGRFSAVDLEIA